MEGDFGMVSRSPFALRLAGSIAKGDACCRLIREAKQ